MIEQVPLRDGQFTSGAMRYVTRGSEAVSGKSFLMLDVYALSDNQFIDRPRHRVRVPRVPGQTWFFSHRLMQAVADYLGSPPP